MDLSHHFKHNYAIVTFIIVILFNFQIFTSDQIILLGISINILPPPKGTEIEFRSKSLD